MSDAFHGADVAALRQQALALCGATDVIITCVTRITTALDAMTWRGQDAERIREEWRTQHAPALLRVAQALNDAAVHLVEEADRQEAASAATGASATGASVTGAAGAAPTSPTLRETVRRALDAAHDATSSTIGFLGHLSTATDLGLLKIAGQRWDNVAAATTAAPLELALPVLQDAFVPKAVGAVSQGVAVLGVASDAYGAVRAHREGDLYKTVDNGVSAVISAGGFVPGGAIPSMALGISWQAGTAVGERLNEAMQGTAFQDRFTERMDAAFDVVGAWGMLNTPGALIVTGVEEVGLRVQDAWQGLTGTGDGTLDSRR